MVGVDHNQDTYTRSCKTCQVENKGNLGIQYIPVSGSISFISCDGESSLRRIYIFLARVYVRAWFLSSEAINSHDLISMCQLILYQDIDPDISKAAAIKKIQQSLVLIFRNCGSIHILMFQQRLRQIQLKLCWKLTKSYRYPIYRLPANRKD